MNIISISLGLSTDSRKNRKKEDIAEMRTGVDPVKPEDEKVEEAK